MKHRGGGSGLGPARGTHPLNSERMTAKPSPFSPVPCPCGARQEFLGGGRPRTDLGGGSPGIPVRESIGMLLNPVEYRGTLRVLWNPFGIRGSPRGVPQSPPGIHVECRGFPQSPLESVGIRGNPSDSQRNAGEIIGVRRNASESLGAPRNPMESLQVPWEPHGVHA